VGFGTTFVESLISYVIRLAKAYCISPKLLVMQEILPSLERPISAYTSRVHTAWSENAYTINGMNVSTIGWVQKLEELTSRNDLRLLTMMTWSEVISRFGMFRTAKAWCPICYEEARQSGKIVYDPLVWSFQSVTVCTRHCCPLSFQCPHEVCRRKPPVLTSHSLPGHCTKCSGWLGVSSLEGVAAIERKVSTSDLRYWAAEVVGDLVESASTVSYPIKRELLMERISFYLEQEGRGKIAILATKLGVSENLITAWLQGRRIPKFSTILQMCVRLDTSPVCFLTGKEPIATFTNPSLFIIGV